MECTRAFCCVVALTLAPLILNDITGTLAIESIEPESIVIFPGDDHKLHVDHRTEHSLGSHPESLELHFYRQYFEENSNDSTKVLSDKRHHLSLFSETEKKECLKFNDSFNGVSNESRFCIDTSSSQWSGGVMNEKWPLNDASKWNRERPFVTWAPTENSSYDHSVIEYYFFNTQGYYLYLDETVPLYVMVTEYHKICFAAKSNTSPFYKSNDKVSMTFQICKYNNTREAHENAIRDVLGKPENLPHNYESIVKNLIWSTRTNDWSQGLDASEVLRYAEEIKNHSFPLGTLEIEKQWRNCSSPFHVSEIDELTKIVKGLNDSSVSLWITPFVSTDCMNITQTTHRDDYFVKNASNQKFFQTWSGINASHVDFTNPSASYWWGNDTQNLLNQTGIKTLVFVGGESNWYPLHPNFHTDGHTYPDNVNANIETLMRVSDAIQYKSFRRGQRFGNFLRLLDYNSNVNWTLALSMLVPSLINANMLGYPFVVPNVIGSTKNAKKFLRSDFYIRWMQAVTFMPAVQYSYPPWYKKDNDTENICKKLINIRNNKTETIIKLMKMSVKNGSPVNPPIWWIDPTDPVAHTINDEYLLGDDILVAPVIVANARSRDIYFPKGRWQDQNNGNFINGRYWERNYSVPLDDLPWFIKVGENETRSVS